MDSITDNEIAERIVTARKDAELLKDRIRQKRDHLSDTTCKDYFLFYCIHWLHSLQSDPGCTKSTKFATLGNESTADIKGSFGQSLCLTMGIKQAERCICFTGWQIADMECILYAQTLLCSSKILMGHDVCLLTQWETRCFGRIRQYVLHSQFGITNKTYQGIIRTYRIPELLSIFERSSNIDIKRRY